MTVVGIVGICCVLYLFLLMPRFRGRPDIQAFRKTLYAHRGLYDNQGDAPENSMLAFQKAVEQGYGIEMDVQLTRDRIPVVFHDETLKRICGVEGRVRDYTYQELQEFPLCNSEQRIPLFADYLNLVDGKVPLIIEIKIHESAKVVCEAVDKVLQGYKGAYCMESFHPLAVRWYRKNRPEILRGQLSSNFNKTGKRESPAEFLVHYLLLNFLAKPDFIAYDHNHKKNISRLICKHFYHSMNVAWTIRSQKELDENREDYEWFIFEGFLPEEK